MSRVCIWYSTKLECDSRFVNTVWFKNLTTKYSAVRELRFLSFGVWRRVVGWVLPDVSKDRVVCLLQAAGPSSTLIGKINPEEEGITIGWNMRSFSPTGTLSHVQEYRCKNLKCRPVHYSLHANAQTDTHVEAKRGNFCNLLLQAFRKYYTAWDCLVCFQNRKHGVGAKLVAKCLKIHRHAAGKGNTETDSCIWPSEFRLNTVFKMVQFVPRSKHCVSVIQGSQMCVYKRKIQAHSHSHCCRSKAIMYQMLRERERERERERALVIQHVKRMRRIYCHL